MGLYMSFTVTMDRPIEKGKHYLDPGGYEVVINGKTVEFDFENSVGSVDPENPCKITFTTERLDLSCFPEAKMLMDKENVRAISRIEDFYVYTGEKNEDPEINVVSIDAISFGSDGWDEDVDVPESVLKEYNKTLCR